MSPRPFLKLVAEPAEQRPGKLFCGHCAREPSAGPSSMSGSRPESASVVAATDGRLRR